MMHQRWDPDDAHVMEEVAASKRESTVLGVTQQRRLGLSAPSPSCAPQVCFLGGGRDDWAGSSRGQLESWKDLGHDPRDVAKRLEPRDRLAQSPLCGRQSQVSRGPLGWACPRRGLRITLLGRGIRIHASGCEVRQRPGILLARTGPRRVETCRGTGWGARSGPSAGDRARLLFPGFAGGVLGELARVPHCRWCRGLEPALFQFSPLIFWPLAQCQAPGGCLLNANF